VAAHDIEVLILIMAERVTACDLLERHFPLLYSSLSHRSIVDISTFSPTPKTKTQNSPRAMVRTFLTFYTTEVKPMTSTM
jgi:hypothetical protein